MTEREAFEVWAKTQGMVTVKNPNGIYVEFDPRQAWLAWQASRRIALEDAAKVCDDEKWVIGAQRTSTYMETFNKACDDCRAIIRSRI